MLKNILLASTLIFTSKLGFALPASAQEELAKYVTIFESENIFKHVKTTEKLEWAGFSQPELFDLIAEKLEKNYKDNSSQYNIDDLAWFCKALGFSGNSKYEPLLVDVRKNGYHKKIRRYAKISKSMLSDYSQWNQLILNEESWREDLSLEHNRYYNMLNSEELVLKRLAAKRIHYTNDYDSDLLDLLEKQLLKGFKTADSKLEVDTYAWMTKALAGSRNIKYKPTVINVMENAEFDRLQNYAEKYLKYYR